MTSVEETGQDFYSDGWNDGYDKATGALEAGFAYSRPHVSQYATVEDYQMAVVSYLDYSDGYVKGHRYGTECAAAKASAN